MQLWYADSYNPATPKIWEDTKYIQKYTFYLLLHDKSVKNSQLNTVYKNMLKLMKTK